MRKFLLATSALFWIGSVNAAYVGLDALGPAVQITSGNALLALEYSNSAGTPVKVEIFPNSTAKPDEGNASVNGTVAWAAAQLTAGGQIFVHEGNYNISTTITLSTQGTELVCADNKSTIFNAPNSFNNTMIKLGWAGTQRQGMAVRNCGFNGNLGGNSSGVAIWARDTAYAKIYDNNIEFMATNAVILDASTTGAINNIVSDNIMYECTEECFVINGKGGAGTTTDNIIKGNSIGGSLYGDGTKPMVSISGQGSLQWVQNHVWGQASANTHTDCIQFNSYEADIMIVGSEVESCSQYGINFESAYPYNIAMTGNSFYNNGGGSVGNYGDINLNSANFVTIIGNTFFANSVAKNGVYSSQGTHNNVIEGNTFLGYSGYAISLTNAYAATNFIGANTYSQSGGTYTLAGTQGYPNSTPVLNNPLLSSVPGQVNVNSLQLTQLASGPTPTITTAGTAGSATWTYVIVPKDINGQAAAAGSSGSTATGNATLTGSNYNVISWAAINGAYSYDVYRTAHGTSPTTLGYIGNVLATSVLSTGANSYSLNDTGLAGNSATAPTINQTGSNQAAVYQTGSNCNSSASPAVCGSAAAGSAAVATGTNPTLVVDTTAVTANSQILLTPDESLGAKLSVTCNSTITTQGPLVVTARSPGVSFTVEVDATVGTNPVCFNYSIVN